MRPRSAAFVSLASLLLLAPLAAAQNEIFGIHGGGVGGNFGAAVAGADVSGDGKLDALVGAPDDDSSGISAGMVRAYDAGGSTVLFTLLGPSANQRFGASLTTLGDLNGDGFDDFAVGAPGDDSSGANTGAVYVYSGKTHSLLYKLVGQAAGDQFGFAIADVGDVSGDGARDLGVGAPFHNVGGADAGNVRVFSGPDGSLLHTLPGGAAGDEFGFSLAGMGDVDNDGHADFVVGAPHANLGGGNESGAILAFSGGAFTEAWYGYGGTPFGHLGWSVARMSGQRIAVAQPDHIGTGQAGGEVVVLNVFSNGFTPTVAWTGGVGFGSSLDGFAPAVANDNLVIGSPKEFNEAGVAYLLDVSNTAAPIVVQLTGTFAGARLGAAVSSFGFNGGVSAPRMLVGAPDAQQDSSGPRVGSMTRAGTSTTATVYGNSFGERLGASIAFVGDVDGDGTPDFVIGAPKSDQGVPDGGRARVTSGATGSMILELEGTQTGAQFGASVGGAGDYDNDGVPDVIVGAPFETVGSAAEAGRARVFSGKNGAVLDSFSTGSANDHFGWSVAGAGDVNNNGIDDVVIGAPGGGGAQIGLVRVFSGVNGALLQSHTGDASGDQLGTAVAGVGDVNDDGFPDVAAGAPFHAYGPLNPSSGFVRVWSGKDGSVISTLHGFSTSELGLSVAAAKDVDADGYADVIAGALNMGSGIGLIDRGAVLVFSGRTGALLFSELGDHAHDHLGASVVGLGDVNKDGFPEFAAGATTPIPPFLFFGTGYVRVFNGADGAALMTIEGDAAGDQLGACVARAGDLNGDGAPDLLVGAPTSNVYATGSGYARAYSVAPKGLTIYGTGTPGCSGAETLFGNSTPVAGNAEFRLTTVKSPPSSLGLLLIGNAKLAAGGDPLGLGILFHIDLFASTQLYALDMTIDAGGRGQSAVPIPDNPSLTGLHFFAQSISAWTSGPCLPSPFGLSSTTGLDIHFQ